MRFYHESVSAGERRLHSGTTVPRSDATYTALM